MIRKIKEFIANLLDAICAETYEPAEFYLQVIDGEIYVLPFRQE